MKILVNLTSLLLGRALKELLEREPESYQVMEAADIRQCQEFHPDFIILDSRTLHASANKASHDTKVVMLDACASDEEMTSLLLTHRIDGVLSATTDLPLFKKALDKIGGGQIWIDNNRIKAIVRHGGEIRNGNHDHAFSSKEREIIHHVSRGLTNRAIADDLHISEQTVKTHLSRIFRKARISRRSQLVPLAIKMRIPDSA